MDAKTYVNPGDFFSIELPWSEVNMHMRVAGQRMTAELTTGQHPMVQLWKDGHHFSFPVGTGEAGLYRDQDGYYGYGITDIHDGNEYAPGWVTVGSDGITIELPRRVS